MVYTLYAVTAKKLGRNKDVNKEYYEEVVKPIFTKSGCILQDEVYETDPKGKLHYHSAWYFPNECYRKHLAIQGCHMKFVEVYDALGWESYMRKQFAKPQ